MTRDEIMDVLIFDAEYEREDVMNMAQSDLLDAWLTWEGIVGYTSDIIEAVADLYGVELNDDEEE